MLSGTYHDGVGSSAVRCLSLDDFKNKRLRAGSAEWIPSTQPQTSMMNANANTRCHVLAHHPSTLAHHDNTLCVAAQQRKPKAWQSPPQPPQPRQSTTTTILKSGKAAREPTSSSTTQPAAPHRPQRPTTPPPNPRPRGGAWTLSTARRTRAPSPPGRAAAQQE